MIEPPDEGVVERWRGCGGHDTHRGGVGSGEKPLDLTDRPPVDGPHDDRGAAHVGVLEEENLRWKQDLERGRRDVEKAEADRGSLRGRVWVRVRFRVWVRVTPGGWECGIAA